MGKNILYLIVIIAAFLIVLFNSQLNIIIKILALLSLGVGAAVMIEAIVQQKHSQKE